MLRDMVSRLAPEATLAPRPGGNDRHGPESRPLASDSPPLTGSE
jgi:hypothetical protein